MCLVAHASSEICLGVDLEPDEWIKDSGCSKHMTGNRKLFSTYKAYNGDNVIFGSNLRGNIIGKGTISNDSLKIDNVEHVDNLGFNLLSIGQICDNKCRVTSFENDSEITKPGKVIGMACVLQEKPILSMFPFSPYHVVSFEPTHVLPPILMRRRVSSDPDLDLGFRLEIFSISFFVVIPTRISAASYFGQLRPVLEVASYLD
nr:integrase, catalytic region, zinc finger, CCHC-type, peptidase aspartic, catalytic [Tanacetum cinerariifolium]